MDSDSDALVLLGRHIKQMRIKKGITQQQLCKSCDCEEGIIDLIEKGKTDPTLLEINQIAKALNVSLAEIFGY